MNIKPLLRLILGLFFTTVVLNSCVKDDEWDTPPIKCNDKFGAVTMSMADFVAMTPTVGTLKIPNEAGDPEVIIEGYVNSSDENGNFYKTISFQDKPSNPTVGLQIEVDKSGNYADFPVGSHIKIRANGLVLGRDRGVIKIGSVDPTYAIGRIPSAIVYKYLSGVCNGSSLEIAKLVPMELANLEEAKKEQYINLLVKVPNVQFSEFELGKTFVNQNPADDTERALIDNNGYTTVLRNSAFATFGSQILPTGNGAITFVVSRYNINWQMYIRNLDDIQFSGTRFGECASLTANATLGDLKALYPASETNPIQITNDYTIEAYVSSTDISGNIYKTLYVQDQLVNPTHGLTIITNMINMYAKYPVGTKVYIKAKNLYLAKSGGVVQLTDKVFNTTTGVYDFALTDQKLNTNIVKACTQSTQNIVPLVMSSTNLNNNLVGALVKFEKAQFDVSSLYNYLGGLNTYANPATTTNRIIEYYKTDNTFDNTIIARNSGFSNFASASLPTGNGSVIGILSKFNSDWQLYLREYSDVNMTGSRLDATPPKGGTAIAYSGAFTENFESYATSPANLEVFPKYLNDPLFGNRYWQLKTFGGNKYIQLSANAGSGNYHTFFMVPVDFTAANAMSFKVNYGYVNGSPLKVYYTTDYTGDITTATLTEITSSFTFPTGPTSGYGVLTSAGTYNIPASVTGNGYFIFKYEGNSSGITTTAQIDDITVN